PWRRDEEPAQLPWLAPHSGGLGRKDHARGFYLWSDRIRPISTINAIRAKFFDRVHHQRLLARIAQRVTDQRIITLVRRMLTAAVVMPDGTKVAVREGTPQGGPLSPMLSNIVLDELDRELARRGHRFVRYADDANIFVR